MEGSDRGLTEVPMPGETKGKFEGLVPEEGKQDGSHGKCFVCRSGNRVHRTDLVFAMLNTQASQVLVRMFVICRGGSPSPNRGNRA